MPSIYKIINKLSLLIVVITTIVAVQTFAIPPIYSMNLKPQNWINTFDNVTYSYDPMEKVIRWNGIVTFTDGCKYIEKNTLNPIMYFVAPKPTDPIFSHNLTIGSNGTMCTQVVTQKNFSGKLKFNLTSINQNNFLTLFKLDWSIKDKPSEWFDNINFKKLDWKKFESSSINIGLFKLELKYKLFNQEPSKDQCISVTRRMLGWVCTFIEAKPISNWIFLPTRLIRSSKELANYIPKINSIQKLHFVADAIRTNGWDLGEVIYNNKPLMKVQNECTTDVSYYEIIKSSNGFETKFLKSEIYDDIPAICE
jgi:hypothetical protein